MLTVLIIAAVGSAAVVGITFVVEEIIARIPRR